MTCGIYQITNKVNGHCYIGSSLDVEKRFSEHLRALRRGKHHSRYFQRAAKLGKKHTPEHIANIIAGHKARKEKLCQS